MGQFCIAYTDESSRSTRTVHGSMTYGIMWELGGFYHDNSRRGGMAFHCTNKHETAELGISLLLKEVMRMFEGHKSTVQPVLLATCVQQDIPFLRWIDDLGSPSLVVGGVRWSITITKPYTNTNSYNEVRIALFVPENINGR